MAWSGYLVRTAASGGSELLIFVPGAAHSPDSFSWSIIAGPFFTRWGESAQAATVVKCPDRVQPAALALALAAVAVGLVVVEPFPKGKVLFSLTSTHGVDTGDLPALAMLLVAVVLAIRSRSRTTARND